VTVGIADAERAVRLAEGRETARLHLASRRREIVERGTDVEGDVIQAGHALGLRPRPFGARQLAGEVVMMDAGREEHDTPVLPRPRLRETEQVAVEATRGVEIAHEQRDVSQLADFHGRLVYHCSVMVESKPAVLSGIAGPPLFVPADREPILP